MSQHHGSQPIPGSKVHIAAGAITTIVEEVVLSCYAFVGMAPRLLSAAIGRRLGESTSTLTVFTSAIHHGVKCE